MFNTPSEGGTPLANLTPEKIQTLMNLINNELNNGECMTGEFCDMAWIMTRELHIKLLVHCHVYVMCLMWRGD